MILLFDATLDENTEKIEDGERQRSVSRHGEDSNHTKNEEARERFRA